MLRSDKLKPEYEALASQFALHYENGGCTCFIRPPCSYCTHEGNPRNLQENDDAWEPVEMEFSEPFRLNLNLTEIPRQFNYTPTGGDPAELDSLCRGGSLNQPIIYVIRELAIRMSRIEDALVTLRKELRDASTSIPLDPRIVELQKEVQVLREELDFDSIIK